MKATRLKFLTVVVFFMLLSVITPSILMAQDLTEFTVEGLSGKVLMLASGGSSWTPVTLDMKISAGDTLKTEADSFIQIGAKGVGVFSLGQKTEMIVNKISVQQSNVDAELEMKLGDLKAKLAKMNPGSNFQVKTPTSVAAIRGTEFLVSVVLNVAGKIETMYMVFSGSLTVNSISGIGHIITAEKAEKFSSTGEVTEIPKGSTTYNALEWCFKIMASREFHTSDISIENISVEEASATDDPVRESSPST